MKLLTKEIQRKLPPLGSMDEKEAKDIPIIMKFFTCWSNWTWYVAEGSAILEDGSEVAAKDLNGRKAVDWLFFGLVRGHETELGNFVLSELAAIRGRFGLKIERDLYFRGHTLQEALDKSI